MSRQGSGSWPAPVEGHLVGGAEGTARSHPIRSYFARQIGAIGADPVLRTFGIALAVAHLVTFINLVAMGAANMLARDSAICWPLLDGCEAVRRLSSQQWMVLFCAYGGLATIVGGLFANRDSTRGAYLSLVLLELFKWGLIALDFRFRKNQNYMASAAVAVFLFAPQKRDSLRLLIVLFYVWAGTLKLNMEWLSGAALYKQPWPFSGKGVVLACAYVVVLELFAAWGLLARRAWLFWSSFAQAVLFHVVSWSVVGFFYPLLMFALLAIFPLARLLGQGEPRSLAQILAGSDRRWSPLVLGGLFSLLQMIPWLFPGRSALTGEGRLFALHMFDGAVSCQATARVHTAPDAIKEVNLRLWGETRIGCDPLTIWRQAQRLCRDQGPRPPRVDVRLRSRLVTMQEEKLVVSIDDFCNQKITYSPFHHNGWIRSDGP